MSDKAELVVVGSQQLANRDGEWSVAQIIDQKRKIVEIMQAVMKADEHYGVIPGAKKPSLWKPGAETLCLTFRLNPEYEVLSKIEERDHISFTIRCTLSHINTGNRIATGLGSCNSREEKYRRPAPKLCPKCLKPAIIKGKEEYGGGWVCFKKKDGCGSNFKDDDKAITGQTGGMADPSDLHNTILKMACKRALIAAVLNGTAASDCFAQDLEDLPVQFMDDRPAEAPLKHAPAPVGPNVPVPSKAGRGSWPKEVPKERLHDEAEAMDAEFQATVTGLPRAHEPMPQARIIDDSTVEVYDIKSGECSTHPRPSKAMAAKLQILLKELKIPDGQWRAGLQKYYSVDSATLLSKAQCQDAIDRLEITRAKAADILPQREPGDDTDSEEKAGA